MNGKKITLKSKFDGQNKIREFCFRIQKNPRKCNINDLFRFIIENDLQNIGIIKRKTLKNFTFKFIHFKLKN